MWLDPMPLEEDLPRAYQGYFTHREPASVPRPGRLARTVRREYLALRYGARREQGSPFERLAGLVLYAWPLRRINVDASLMFLPVIAGGRIVDVGCASGGLLRGLAEAGWRAEGTDPDGDAVALARARGLDAHVGTLADRVYATGTFDAMTLSHTIEHVPDPDAVLAEGHRILKPGGRLAILTPNGRAFGHRWFQASWFPLEPPRHLHIFTLAALSRVLERNGFRVRKGVTVPRNIRDVVHGSRAIARGGRYALGAPGGRGDGARIRILTWLELAAAKVVPVGEEIVLVAEKPAC